MDGDPNSSVHRRFLSKCGPVQVQARACLDLEVGVAVEDPAAIGPGTDRVGIEPSPDRRSGNLGDDPSLEHLRPDVGDLETGQGKAQGSGQLTGDRPDLNHHLSGENPLVGSDGSTRLLSGHGLFPWYSPTRPPKT